MKILSFVILLLLHPVHVSLTGIDYDTANRRWSLFVKVYSDDLEADMNLGSSSGEEFTGEEQDRYIQYLADRIIIMEDGRQLEMKLLNDETDGLEHRFNITAVGAKRFTGVTVMNRIMTRLYDDQANMVLFSFDGIEEGDRFTATDTMKIYKVK
ncbi:MAG: hypothetical protein RBT02_07925 [Bacteroidales bacterium]|jgi:hypothetical protein|nr:hypothetical protein [Bacteroidales bacterium]